MKSFTSFVNDEDAADYLKRGYWSDTETIPSLLYRNAKERPTDLAVIDDSGRQFTHIELHSLSSKIASGLQSRGIKSGDVLGMQMPNRAEASLIACAIEK